MAARLKHAPKNNSVLSSVFLSSEGVKTIEAHRRMNVQYSDAFLSLQQVYEWTRKFMNGISSVTDSPRPGQAHPVVTPEAVAAVEAIVKENRRLTVNEDYSEWRLQWMETTEKSEVIVYILCSINYEIKIFKVFIWLTLVHFNIILPINKLGLPIGHPNVSLISPPYCVCLQQEPLVLTLVLLSTRHKFGDRAVFELDVGVMYMK